MKGRLQQFQHEVLTALEALGGESWGQVIRDYLAEHGPQRPTVSAVKNTLSRLEGKGYVSSEMELNVPNKFGYPSGKSRRIFRITDPGRNALTETRKNRIPEKNNSVIAIDTERMVPWVRELLRQVAANPERIG